MKTIFLNNRLTGRYTREQPHKNGQPRIRSLQAQKSLRCTRRIRWIRQRIIFLISFFSFIPFRDFIETKLKW